MINNPMGKWHTLDNLDPKGKKVLVRLDLNLPLQNGHIIDFTRLQRSLPTIRELIAGKAKVIIISHLGRPKGQDKSLSLAPIAKALQEVLAPTPVFFCDSYQGSEVLKAIAKLREGEVLLLENIRFSPDEEKNSPRFSREIAGWGEVYVNDAFSTAHRAHASTEGIAHLLPKYAGRLMEEEITALQKALESPHRPLMGIVGGAKISTKLPLLENLLPKVDILVIGGAMANTLLAAQGYNVGSSLYEPAFLETVAALLKKSSHLLLPEDVVVAKDLEDIRSIEIRDIRDIEEDEKIFDIGPVTCERIIESMSKCHTVLWNGPLGVFEVPPFDRGTTFVAQEAASLTKKEGLVSVVGGGDTLAALSHAQVLQDFTYVSTAGGAFLEWLEGKSLPGIEALFV